MTLLLRLWGAKKAHRTSATLDPSWDSVLHAATTEGSDWQAGSMAIPLIEQ